MNRGFASIALIIALVIIAGGAGYWALTQKPSAVPTTTEPPAPQESTETVTESTTDYEPTQSTQQTPTAPTEISWKIYGDSHFSLRYPSDYPFLFNLCLKDCASYSTKGSSDSYIEVEAEKKGGCYLDLCRASVKNRQTFNDVTWDYLGLQSYGDVGVLRSFYVYRTTYGGYSYHVLFNKDMTINKTVMQSFKFGSSQALSDLTFLSPKSGDVLKQGLWHVVRLNRAIAPWPEDVRGKLILIREDNSIVGEIFKDITGDNVSIKAINAGTIDNLIKIVPGQYKLRLVANDSTQKLLAESEIFTIQE